MPTPEYKFTVGRDLVSFKLARYADGRLRMTKDNYFACDCLNCQCTNGLKVTTEGIFSSPRQFRYSEADLSLEWTVVDFTGEWVNGVYNIPQWIDTGAWLYPRLCSYYGGVDNYGSAKIETNIYDYGPDPINFCERDPRIEVVFEKGDEYGTRGWRGDGWITISIGGRQGGYGYYIFMGEFKGFDGSPLTIQNQITQLSAPGVDNPIVHSWQADYVPYIAKLGTVTIECSDSADVDFSPGGSNDSDGCIHSDVYTCWRRWSWTINCDNDGPYIESGPTLTVTQCNSPAAKYGDDALDGWELTQCPHDTGSSEYRATISKWVQAGKQCGTEEGSCNDADMTPPAAPSPAVIATACQTCTGGGLTCSFRYTACYNCETGQWVQEPRFIPNRHNVYCGVEDPFGTEWQQSFGPVDGKVCWERWVSGERCNENIAQCTPPDPNTVISRPTTSQVIEACEGGSGSSGDGIGMEMI